MKSFPESQVEQALRRISLFKGLAAPVLGRIAKSVRMSKYSPGAWIVAYGDESRDVYFIVEGTAIVAIDSKEAVRVIFRELGTGEIFGEYAAIDHKPRSATVQARTECRIASMSADAFRKLLYAEPDLSWALLEHFVMETRELTTRVYEFSTLCVSNRVQAEILRMAREVTPQSGGNVADINPAPSDAEIAARISTHREAVNREISHLSKRGILRKHDHAILVSDIVALENMVHQATGE